MRDQCHAPGSPAPREWYRHPKVELAAALCWVILGVVVFWGINQTDCATHSNRYCDYQNAALARHQQK